MLRIPLRKMQMKTTSISKSTGQGTGKQTFWQMGPAGHISGGIGTINILSVCTVWARNSLSRNYPIDTYICVKWHLLLLLFFAMTKTLEVECSGRWEEESRRVRVFKFWYKMLSKMWARYKRERWVSYHLCKRKKGEKRMYFHNCLIMDKINKKLLILVASWEETKSLGTGVGRSIFMVLLSIYLEFWIAWHLKIYTTYIFKI